MQAVKVTHKLSALYGQIGNIVTVNSTMATVDFGKGITSLMFKWQIEPTAKYTDMSKQTKPTDLISRMKAKRDEAAQYNTDAAVVVVKVLDELMG